VRQHCADIVGYARARSSGNFEDCGDSQLCRTMLDEGSLKASYEHLKTLACLKNGGAL
jgi:hypothetical protein